MSQDMCLHPDLIEEVIEELFATDVISQDKLQKLKNDVLQVDPNLMMDIRHKEVKKESLIDLEGKTPEVIKRRMENICKENLPKVKDLKTIDKEILSTRKCLEEFQNKLVKKNECLKNSIQDLEKKWEDLNYEVKVEDEERDSPLILELNKQETNNYFNLHLDCLEYALNKNHQKDNIKTWRPIEVNPPVINGITTFKDCDGSSTSRDDLEEEIKLLKMYEFNVFHISGKNVEISSQSQTEQSNNLVPINSPTFNVSITIDDKSKLTSKQKKIVQKALKTWQLNVRRKKICKWSEGKLSKFRISLLKKYFSIWISYTKQCKRTKETNLTQSSDSLEIVPSKCLINPKKCGVGSFHCKAAAEPHQNKNQSSVDQVPTVSPAIKKSQTEIICNKVFIPPKEKRETVLQNKPENRLNKTEVHVKTLTPHDVGLIQHTNTTVNQVCKNQSVKHVHEVNDNMASKSFGEPLLHRFEAQEKIIKQQRQLIEKQNKIIFDLQAKCLEIESKLNWTLAERQLTEAESQVTKSSVSHDNKPTRKLKQTKSISQECHYTKTQDKSDLIVKNMLERQAYCSQLAEQTKLRKKRLEEEKERLKLEQNEKQKQEKEEERKKRILQMKMEHQIAQEKEKNILALRKKEAELIEKAVQHHRNNLLRRSFVALKTVCLDVFVKSDDCDRIYRQKLIHKVFSVWKEKVKHSIQLKYQFAEKHYHKKLLRVAWCQLRKVHQEYKIRLQVSEDLYNLKLQERMFHRWQSFAAQQFLQNCCKIELAERLHRRQLLRSHFRHWKELPRLMFKEREKEQRRRAWRNTVQQLIPDFTPAYVNEM